MNPAQKHGPSVLIVEDEEALAQGLSDRLSREDYRCLVASKMSEALKKLRNQKFDLILLDLKLEQGTGEKVVEEIRNDKGNLNFASPVIVMSGHLDAARIQALKTQVQGFLVKPFEVDALVAKAKSVLV